MEFTFFLKGLILGLSIAAPVGPMSVLCIRRTLTNGRLSGFVSGLGIATADAAYGVVAAGGLSIIAMFFVMHRVFLQVIGGLFLLYLGYTTFSAKVVQSGPAKESFSVWKDYLSAFFSTLTNPMTILSFVAIFAGLGIGAQNGDYASAFLLVLGVFLGSVSWWLALTGIVSSLSCELGQSYIYWINRISGSMIAICGIWSLSSLCLS